MFSTMKAPLTHRCWWTFSPWNVTQPHGSMNWAPPPIDFKPWQSAAALPRVAFWSAFCQTCWRLLTCHSAALAKSMLIILLRVAEKTGPQPEATARPRESWSYFFKSELLCSDAGTRPSVTHRSGIKDFSSMRPKPEVLNKKTLVSHLFLLLCCSMETTEHADVCLLPSSITLWRNEQRECHKRNGSENPPRSIWSRQSWKEIWNAKWAKCYLPAHLNMANL